MRAEITRVFEEFPGFVYFLKNEGTGLIKIGWTGRNLLDRVQEIHSMSGAEMLLIGAMYGSRQDEKALHHALRAHRSYGEWFHQTDEVIACIVDIFSDKPKITTPEAQIA